MDFEKFAAKFGTYEDWNLTRPLAIHLMKELARAHWDDEGERLGGFEVATCGLNIAVIGDEGRSDPDMVAGVLQIVARLARYLASSAPIAEQSAALEAILLATDAWKGSA